MQTTTPNSEPRPSSASDTTRARFEAARAALAEEHRQLMTLVETLKRAPPPAVLVRRLDELHRLLVNHFAHEQFPGGLYETMGAFGSRWHEDLRGLIQDHCHILSEARAILERARKSTPAERNELQVDVNALIERLAEHERKEHRLAERLQTGSTDTGA